MKVIDLRAHPEKESEALKVSWEDTFQPFDLAQGPLMRVTLLQLEDEHNELLLTMHHMISDGVSLSIFYRELIRLYEAFSLGKPSPLAPLPLQYADFAVWKRRWLQSGKAATQLSYWKKQLNALSMLELPLDHPRPAMPRVQGAIEQFVLSKSLSQALRTMSKDLGCTLFMTQLAALQALFYCYTGQTDSSIITAVANRNHHELRELIGFFSNTLVLRTDLSNNPTIRELLARVRQTTLEAYAHQHLPFIKVVEIVQQEIGPDNIPVFPVAFYFHSWATPMETLKDSEPFTGLIGFTREVRLSTHDLTIDMADTSAGIITYLDYNTSVFDKNTIRKIIEEFVIVLEYFVANHDQHLSQLSLQIGQARAKNDSSVSCVEPPLFEYLKEERYAISRLITAK